MVFAGWERSIWQWLMRLWFSHLLLPVFYGLEAIDAKSSAQSLDSFASRLLFSPLVKAHLTMTCRLLAQG